MSSEEKHRLTILTEIIAPYRIPVFNALACDKTIDLHVIFLAETDTALRQWRVYKDEIDFSYEVLHSRRWRVGKHNVLLNSGVAKALSAASPDSIVCGGYNYVASWEALLWSRRNDVAFFLWSESNRQDKRDGRAAIEFLKREFLKRCTGFVVPGKSALAYLESLGVSTEKIIIAPDAVNNEFFSNEAKAARENADALREKLTLPACYILYAGRLIREKGVFDLLDAYSNLDVKLRLKIGLVYVGDGIAKSELQAKAREVVPGEILFPGFAQREELVQFYALAEVFVLPTHSDPWGLVVNEAMACGLPIIASDVAGCVPDLVEDGWNGYVIPAQNPERLCAALRSFFSDPAKNCTMGKNSYDHVQEFSPEICAQGLARVATRCTLEVQ